MGLLTTIARIATGLMVTGAWTAGNQYTREKMNSSSAHIIREVERTVEHQAVKLELIKRDK